MSSHLDLDLEKLLKESLDRNLNKPDGKTSANLAESIRYSLLAPGKRIRPRLMLTCADMLELPLVNVVPAALALEMIHCFTLIHDDLPCMDDDDFRRGLPSNHKKFGEAVALLAGDSLMALATEVFFESSISEKNLISGFKRFIWAAGPRGVMGGQAAESLLGSHSTLEDLRSMHAQKTGALFSAAILVPKEFAGISDDSDLGQSLISFGYELGLAFQAADDLEDAREEAQGQEKVGQAPQKHEPTSVLFYMPREQASQATLHSLQEASAQLQKAWGPRSSGLRKIAEEVAIKIETAMGNAR